MIRPLRALEVVAAVVTTAAAVLLMAAVHFFMEKVPEALPVPAFQLLEDWGLL
jgi:hypothetical protein